jgi:hypothetical protein
MATSRKMFFRSAAWMYRISLMRGEASGVLGPAPRLVLAMALYQSGWVAEAKKTLAEAVLAYDWERTKVRDQDGWICHVLRREAEAVIPPGLPAVLDGERGPRGNGESLARCGVRQCRTLNVRRVRRRVPQRPPSVARALRRKYRSANGGTALGAVNQTAILYRVGRRATSSLPACNLVGSRLFLHLSIASQATLRRSTLNRLERKRTGLLW